MVIFVAIKTGIDVQMHRQERAALAAADRKAVCSNLAVANMAKRLICRRFCSLSSKRRVARYWCCGNNQLTPGDLMKNIIAIAVALAFSGAALAQAPKAAEPAKATPAVPATPATPAKGEPAKAAPATAATPAKPAEPVKAAKRERQHKPANRGEHQNHMEKGKGKGKKAGAEKGGDKK
jgi:hypothetical protein